MSSSNPFLMGPALLYLGPFVVRNRLRHLWASVCLLDTQTRWSWDLLVELTGGHRWDSWELRLPTGHVWWKLIQPIVLSQRRWRQSHITRKTTHPIFRHDSLHCSLLHLLPLDLLWKYIYTVQKAGKMTQGEMPGSIQYLHQNPQRTSNTRAP